MLKTSSKYIFVFLSLCLGFSFALEAQEKGVLVAKEGAFSDFTLDTALVDMLSAIATDKETIYYEYDTFNRLKTIKDADKNIIQVYDYKYAK